MQQTKIGNKKLTWVRDGYWLSIVGAIGVGGGPQWSLEEEKGGWVGAKQNGV